MTRRSFGNRIGAGLVAAVAAAQVASEKAAAPDSSDITNKDISADLITPDVKRVGSRLRCLCGCAMTVGECNMVGCGHASPARIRIREMLKSGMTDDQIVDVFVKEEGIKILAAPPAKGFNWFGYSAPYLLALAGAGFLAVFIKRMKKPVEAVPTSAAPTDPATLDKYAARAAKDIEDLED
jgi:cytochrome c-type biogenesis protein CcmH/NrfF